MTTKTKAAPSQPRLGRLDSLLDAIHYGGPVAWISLVVMGFGNLCSLQIVKGLLFLAIEVGFILFLTASKGGIYWMSLLKGPGGIEKVETIVNDPLLGEMKSYTETGERSQQALLYGIACICICVMFVIVWRSSVISGFAACSRRKAGKKTNNIVQDIKDLFDVNLHKLLMFLPMAGILIFTVLPLIYMMTMAFTNYSLENNALVTFHWVGLDNFTNILSFNSSIGRQFWSVLGWTLVWAFFATFLNFFAGTAVALIINRRDTKLKNLWRGLLSVTIAVPQFVSLMVIRSMLSRDGIINATLMSWGWIDKALPFFEKNTWARVTVIIVNLWVGIPYTIMQVTGILKNIPSELYEAANLDGANVFQQFANVTLPYMVFVMTPYMITQFTGNINNFNVIYLLTRGDPPVVDGSAGGTDLLVTWLYKLSVDRQQYDIAAVIGILTFLVLSVVALATYRSSGSYKNEEGFN